MRPAAGRLHYGVLAALLAEHRLPLLRRLAATTRLRPNRPGAVSVGDPLRHAAGWRERIHPACVAARRGPRLSCRRVAPGGPTARWPGGAVVRGPRRVLAGLGAFQHHRETVRERRPRGGRPHRVRARDHGDARLGDAMALATRGRGRRARTLGAGDFHVGRNRRVARARAFRAGHQRRSLVVDDRGRRVGCGICCFLLRPVPAGGDERVHAAVLGRDVPRARHAGLLGTAVARLTFGDLPDPRRYPDSGHLDRRLLGPRRRRSLLITTARPGLEAHPRRRPGRGGGHGVRLAPLSDGHADFTLYHTAAHRGSRIRAALGGGAPPSAGCDVGVPHRGRRVGRHGGRHRGHKA